MNLMHKSVLFILFLFPFISSIGQDELEKCGSQPKMQYARNASMKPRWIPDTGRALVFKYQVDYNCPETYHDEFLTRFFWMVPPGQSGFEFNFSHGDSLTMPVHFLVINAPEARLHFLFRSASGTIKGTLNGKVWEVQGTVEIGLYERRRNTIVKKNITVNGTYTAFKAKKRKRYHPLFHFYYK